MSYTIPTMTVPELLAALRAAPAQDVMIIMNDHQQEIIAALSALEGVKGALAPFDAACAKAEDHEAERMRLGVGGPLSDDASPGWGIRYKHLKAARAELSRLKEAGL